MSDEHVSATTVVGAPAAEVFAALADPHRHAGIDGTGWVGAAVDTDPLSRVGQVFRMRMFHEDHPDGDYETANEVLLHEPDRAIAWRTGHHDPEVGGLVFGGWWWRYDLEPAGPGRTRVTLTYDWSGVGPGPREYLDFPMFGTDHLEDSLAHLATMLAPGPAPAPAPAPAATGLIIAGHYRVDPARRDEVVAAFADLVRRARAAEGCLDVAITADSVDPGRVNNLERWTDEESLAAFRAVADPPDLGVEMQDVRVSKFRVDGESDPFD